MLNRMIEHSAYLLVSFVLMILSVGGLFIPDVAIAFVGLSILEIIYLSMLAISSFFEIKEVPDEVL